MGFKISAPVAVMGMIVCGTMCSLLAKLIYSIEGPNRFGETAKFEKPWFQVLAMFFGMSLCILLDLPRTSAIGSNTSERAPLLANGDAAIEQPPPPSVWIISIPTLLDLFATACGTSGLLYTTVSVYQMLRGAMLVWTALLSVMFLRRTLSGKQWGGISFCVGGIALVGVANILAEGPGNGRASVALGVGIILIGQVLQAAQVVIEEWLLQDMAMSSVRIVAWEGLFGVMHCLIWVFPLVMLIPGRDHGRLEDVFDAFYMLVHSWKVVAIVLTDAILMLFYNVFGLEVTDKLSAVHRVVIETLRTLCVWLADLVIYYLISNGKLGEAWTKYSFLQLAGFGLLIAGTVLYNYDAFRSEVKSRAKKAAIEAAARARDAQPDSMVTEIRTAAPATDAEGEKATKKQVAAIAFEGDEEDDEDETATAGSFMGHPVGSASHSNFLLVGTPSSVTEPHSYPGLRQRANAANSPPV